MDNAITAVPKLGLALAVGAGLGAWFFGGLLWTVRCLATASHPAGLMLASFAVRAAGVVTGMTWLVGRHWLLPVIALVGFIAVRSWVLRTWGCSTRSHPAE